jgi:uridine phosphorylase
MNKIKSTDLIVSGGAVYHLGLKPEQLSNKIITVGDPGRVAKVSRYFDRIEHRAEHREFITHTGFFEGKRISIISTGMGTDNIEILMTELDALVNVDLEKMEVKSTLSSLDIVRIGTSGSLRENIPTGSFLASETAIGIDSLMTFYPEFGSSEETKLAEAFQKHIQLPFRPYIARCSTRLLHQVGKGMVPGITLTCPGFYAPQGRAVRLQPFQQDLIGLYAGFQHGTSAITNFEMETAGYYAMGKLLGHNMLSVNVIVANRITNVFSQNADKEMDEAIQLVLSRL